MASRPDDNELAEPRPIVTLRFSLMLLLGLLAALWVGVVAVSGKRAENGCPVSNRLTRETTTELRVFPPGWDCVYRDRSGREVGRSHW